MRASGVLTRALVLAASLAAGAPGWAAPEAYEIRINVAHRDGSAIRDTRITVLGPAAESGPPFAYLRTEAGDAEGRARFQVPQTGTYDIEVLAPGHRSVSSTIEVKDAKYPTPMEIVWAPAPVVALGVRVRDASGAAVVGARVRVARERRPEDEVAPHQHDATTDAQGLAELNIQGSARFTARVRHPLFEPAEAAVEIAEGDSPQSLDVTLRAKPGTQVSAKPPVVPPRPKVTPGGKAGSAPEGGATNPGGQGAPAGPGGSPGKGDAPESAPASFSGRWRHVSGTVLQLTQSGSTVSGTWSHLDSRVSGTVTGRVLEFTTTSARGLDCRGRVTLDAQGGAFFGEAEVTRSASDVGRRFHFDAERAK